MKKEYTVTYMADFTFIFDSEKEETAPAPEKAEKMLRDALGLYSFNYGDSTARPDDVRVKNIKIFERDLD